MSEIIKVFNNLFKKEKTYKNYMMIYFIIFLIFSIIFFIKNYTTNKIDDLINSELNKKVSVFDVKDKDKTISYLNENKKIKNYVLNINKDSCRLVY